MGYAVKLIEPVVEFSRDRRSRAPEYFHAQELCTTVPEDPEEGILAVDPKVVEIRLFAPAGPPSDPDPAGFNHFYAVTVVKPGEMSNLIGSGV